MSENAAENSAASSHQPDVSRDWFLVSLVELVNELNNSIGITLSVSGQLITGLLCSGREYFEEFGKEFASAFQKQENADNIAESFAKYGDIYKNPEELNKVATIFVHMKDVRFISAGTRSIPENRGVL